MTLQEEEIVKIITTQLKEADWEEKHRSNEALLEFQSDFFTLEVDYNPKIWHDALTLTVTNTEGDFPVDIFFTSLEELHTLLERIISFQHKIPEEEYENYILQQLDGFKVNPVS